MLAFWQNPDFIFIGDATKKEEGLRMLAEKGNILTKLPGDNKDEFNTDTGWRLSLCLGLGVGISVPTDKKGWYLIPPRYNSYKKEGKEVKLLG